MKMKAIRSATFSASRLLKLRSDLGITQKIMAQTLGVKSTSCICKWETEENLIPSWAAREFIVAEAMVAVKKARKKKSAKKGQTGVATKTQV